MERKGKNSLQIKPTVLEIFYSDEKHCMEKKYLAENTLNTVEGGEKSAKYANANRRNSKE
jgi:hypothetical protein